MPCGRILLLKTLNIPRLILTRLLPQNPTSDKSGCKISSALDYCDKTTLKLRDHAHVFSGKITRIFT